MGPTSDNGFGVSNNSGVPPASPLYILISVYPETILVTTPFNGFGHGSWRSGMLLGLSCKNKQGMINGSISKPSSTSRLLEPWIQCNDMVVT